MTRKDAGKRRWSRCIRFDLHAALKQPIEKQDDKPGATPAHEAMCRR
jgi:hypothetical protein